VEAQTETPLVEKAVEKLLRGPTSMTVVLPAVANLGEGVSCSGSKVSLSSLWWRRGEGKGKVVGGGGESCERRRPRDWPRDSPCERLSLLVGQLGLQADVVDLLPVDGGDGVGDLGSRLQSQNLRVSAVLPPREPPSKSRPLAHLAQQRLGSRVREARVPVDLNNVRGGD
jgi:hypothetical protein